MNDPERTVLNLLQREPGFVSGASVSEMLGISRSAVHKQINALRRRGYRITGVPHRGYRLEAEPEQLAVRRVAKLTAAAGAAFSLEHHDEIESTNAQAKALALSGAPHGTVVAAEHQLRGRGRLGREWVSPTGRGLLFSVIMRPRLAMSEVHLLALVAAVAAAEAIETQAGVATVLKWPNDLFVGDRKVGGILMEIAGEQDEVEWVVAGIGINVNTEPCELPAALRATATSLRAERGAPVDREGLLAALLLALDARLREAVVEGFAPTLAAFRQRDRLRGHAVSVETRDGPLCGVAAGIDDRGALLVALPDGSIRRFHSGDVTLHR